MSLFADYFHEKTDKHFYETDNGFILYSFPDDKTLYIEEIFVTKEMRRKHQSHELTDEVIKIGKSKGCKYLLGSVVPTAKDATLGLKACLGHGMELLSADKNIIFLRKEI